MGWTFENARGRRRRLPRAKTAAVGLMPRSAGLILAIVCAITSTSTLGNANPNAQAPEVTKSGALPSPFVEKMQGVSQDQWRMVEAGETIRLGPESFIGLPGLERPKIRSLWETGMQHEVNGEHLDACEKYIEISTAVPRSASPHWRIARSYWRHAESLPPEEKEERVRYFQLADAASTRGIDLDADCAECMLWRYASLGRLATTRGVLTAARDVSTMAKLLKHAIELNPQHSDGAYNTTLGNLYYASATFYRMVPDWFWIKWVIGVRGDKERALRDARTAVSLSEMRVDYQIELGASLLCLGERREDELRIEEGMSVLTQAIGLPHLLPTDAIDQEYAKILLQLPHQACSFSRDGFIDVEGAASSGKL